MTTIDDTTTTDTTSTTDMAGTDTAETDQLEQAIGDTADRVFGDFIGAMNTLSITLGMRLGWYTALTDHDSMTSVELASATDSDERYAREWLEQQTVVGYVNVLDASLAPTERRYQLPPESAEVLSCTESLAYMAPFASAIATFGSHIDELVDVYKTGEGFGWDQHGDGARCGQAESNRAMFLHQFGPEFLASIGDVHDVLTAGGRVADIGCGLGWSSIAVARSYPDARVDGYDIDAPSIDMARQNAAESGVDEQVRFFATDAADVNEGEYDVALALECIHDMPDPVSVLSSMHSMVKPGGTVIVMDENVGDTFTGEPDPVEQLFYGFSLICCLPDGRNATDSVATGTVMRRPVFEGYAAEAGFSSVEVLPIEHDFFRFYRLAV